MNHAAPRYRLNADGNNEQNSAKQKHSAAFKESNYLTYQSSFTSKYADYHPEHVAIMGLTAMIKAVAQMKNLRRGHDTQGRLKQIRLDSSSEGYSNFMAPLRMKMIEADAEYASKHSKAKEADEVFTAKILRPSTDTYLTPEWDEFVPFPTSKSTCSPLPGRSLRSLLVLAHTLGLPLHPPPSVSA